MFLLWSRAGVNFRRDEEFTKSLRYSAHPNGELVEIWYAGDAHWSKRLRQVSEDGISNLERVVQAARSLLGNAPFVWQANKSVKDDMLGEKGRLPNAPHGLNGYANIDNIVFLSSLNPPSDHFRFLEWLVCRETK